MTKDNHHLISNINKNKSLCKLIKEDRKELRKCRQKIIHLLGIKEDNKSRHIKLLTENNETHERNFEKFQADLKSNLRVGDHYKDALIINNAIDKFELNGPPLSEIINDERTETSFVFSTPKGIPKRANFSQLNIEPISKMNENSSVQDRIGRSYYNDHEFGLYSVKVKHFNCHFHIKSNDKVINHKQAVLTKCNRCKIISHNLCVSSTEHGKHRCVTINLQRKLIDEINNKKVTIERLFNKNRFKSNQCIAGFKPEVPEIVLALMQYIQMRLIVSGPVYFNEVLSKPRYDEAFGVLKAMKAENSPAPITGINNAVNLLMLVMQGLDKPIIDRDLFDKLCDVILYQPDQTIPNDEDVCKTIASMNNHLYRDTLAHMLIHFSIINKTIYSNTAKYQSIRGSDQLEFFKHVAALLSQLSMNSSKKKDFEKMIKVVSYLMDDNIINFLILRFVDDKKFLFKRKNCPI